MVHQSWKQPFFTAFEPRAGASYMRPETLDEDQSKQIVDALIEKINEYGLSIREAMIIFQICSERVLDYPLDATK